LAAMKGAARAIKRTMRPIVSISMTHPRCAVTALQTQCRHEGFSEILDLA
jgi:hypothetical protein